MFSLKAIVTEVEKDGKSFVSFLVREYAAFYKNEPTLIKTVDTTVSYAEDGIDIVLGMSGNGLLTPEVNAIIEEAVTDLNQAAALVYDFGPSPKAASIFAAVQNNLAALEKDGHIKDPVTQAKMKLIINAIGTLAQIIAKAVAAASGAGSAPAPDAATANA